MADLLEEILNEEKDSKRLKIFRKILPIILVATFIIACGIAGYGWFSSSKIARNKELGDLFIQSFISENANKNQKLIANLLEEVKSDRSNKLFELAAIKIVNNHIQANNVVAAIQSLEEIINDKGYSEITKAYARIIYVTLVIDAEKLSSEQENKTREYLQYFTKETQLFYATSTLLKSLFYLKNQQLDLAEQYATEVLKLSRASLAIKDQAKAIISYVNKHSN